MLLNALAIFVCIWFTVYVGFILWQLREFIFFAAMGVSGVLLLGWSFGRVSEFLK